MSRKYPTDTAAPFIRLHAVALLLCFLSVASAATNTVRFNLGNFTTESAAYKQVRIDPLPSSFPRAEGDQVLGLDPQFFVTDGDGKFTNVMATGDYKITFTNRFKPTPFQITLPSTNTASILNAKDLTSSGTNAPSNLAAFSQAQSDARYVLNSGGKATNTTVTNLYAQGTLWASNGATVLGDLNATGETAFSGTLSVIGASSFNRVSIASNLTVSGERVISADQSVVRATNFVPAARTLFAVTNSTGTTNLLINATNTGSLTVYATNHLKWTNILGLNEGIAPSFVVHVYPQFTLTNLWPSGSMHGYRIQTNDNSTLWASFTNGNKYVVSGTAEGTNLLLTVVRFSQ